MGREVSKTQGMTFHDGPAALNCHLAGAIGGPLEFMARGEEDEMLFEQATRVLEWEKLLEALVTHTHSTIGAAQVRSCLLSTNVEEARWKQQETIEMVRLQEGTHTMPTLSFPDVRETLARASKGAVLETHELRDHAIVLSL